MPNSFDVFNATLPTTAEETVNRTDRDGIIGGLPSYFNAAITNGGLLNGTYDAWCIRTELTIGSNTPYLVNVYSSYGAVPTGVLPANASQTPLPYLSSLQEVNWIFNTVTESGNVVGSGYSYAGTTYTLGDVQLAIWQLLGDTITSQALGTLGPYTQAKATQLQSLAVTNGANFLSRAGQDIGVILSPGGAPATGQPTIIEVKTAGIGDTVFFDRNSNLLPDTGEGMNGVTVQLLADVDGPGPGGFVVVGSAVTGDNPDTPAVETGYYFFGPLLAGPNGGPGITYKVQVVTATLPLGGVGFVNTVDPDGGNNSMSIETLTPGEVNLLQDFGYQAYDFGDAPDPTYPTLLASNGGRHLLSIGQSPATPLLRLGNLIDTELNGQPNAAATGDNISNLNDEDGVVFAGPLVPGTAATVTVTVASAAGVNGKLNAWIDFNRDGDWNDAGEQIFTNLAVGNGPNNLGFTTPADAVGGSTYARFRLSTDANLTPTGAAKDGEVEDYLVQVGAQRASLGNFVWEDLNANGVQDAGEPGVSGVTVTLVGGGADGLINGVGDTTTTQLTDGSGLYQFTNLNPGEQYQVSFTSRARTSASPSPMRSRRAPMPPTATPMSPRARRRSSSLAPGESNQTIDAGLLKPAAVGDFVWSDLNGNGVQNAGEPGVNGVTVTLTGTDALGNPVTRTATTGDNPSTPAVETGYYLFNGGTLLPGTYKATFSNLPAGLPSRCRTRAWTPPTPTPTRPTA